MKPQVSEEIRRYMGALGKIGGSKSSPRKAKTAAQNGRKYKGKKGRK